MYKLADTSLFDNLCCDHFDSVNVFNAGPGMSSFGPKEIKEKAWEAYNITRNIVGSLGTMYQQILRIKEGSAKVTIPVTRKGKRGGFNIVPVSRYVAPLSTVAGTIKTLVGNLSQSMKGFEKFLSNYEPSTKEWLGGKMTSAADSMNYGAHKMQQAAGNALTGLGNKVAPSKSRDLYWRGR